jgi:hypothetical protein
MIWVRFGWSTDPVDVWQTEDYLCEDYQITEEPVLKIEQKFQDQGRVRRVFRGRVSVLLRIPMTEFDADSDPTHARFVWLQRWLRKPTLRIFLHDGATPPAGVPVDGLSYFTAEDNENYVVPVEDTRAQNEQEDVKYFDILLEMAKEVA